LGFFSVQAESMTNFFSTLKDGDESLHDIAIRDMIMNILIIFYKCKVSFRK
jgi:hypothetical protein